MTSLPARIAAYARRRAQNRRRLKATTSGRILIALTLAVGFAAFNTGNNLLFFGWGLLLSSIVVSGILSEATLQAVSLQPRGVGEVRARVSASLLFAVANRRRVPAFAVELRAPFEAIRDDAASAVAVPSPARSFELRLAPGSAKDVALDFIASARGRLRVSEARALTAFPFGFFEKEKRVTLDPIDVVVLPGRVDVDAVSRDLLARLGDAPARRHGPGDELFSLRPFRAGDDPRRIAWRRAAKTGRLVVRETEAAKSNDVMLELVLPASNHDDELVRGDVDHAVDVCASLAEDLLAAGHAVGVRAPGIALSPAAGPRQRSALLTSLALLDACRETPPSPARRAVVVAVVARGAHAHDLVAAVVDATLVAPGSTPIASDSTSTAPGANATRTMQDATALNDGERAPPESGKAA
jgi:uncharacterized protein (DUF58 family)